MGLSLETGRGAGGGASSRPLAFNDVAESLPVWSTDSGNFQTARHQIRGVRGQPQTSTTTVATNVIAQPSIRPYYRADTRRPNACLVLIVVLRSPPPATPAVFTCIAQVAPTFPYLEVALVHIGTHQKQPKATYPAADGQYAHRWFSLHASRRKRSLVSSAVQPHAARLSMQRGPMNISRGARPTFLWISRRFGSFSSTAHKLAHSLYKCPNLLYNCVISRPSFQERRAYLYLHHLKRHGQQCARRTKGFSRLHLHPRRRTLGTHALRREGASATPTRRREADMLVVNPRDGALVVRWSGGMRSSRCVLPSSSRKVAHTPQCTFECSNKMWRPQCCPAPVPAL